MPHPVGERLECESCNAEIVFVRACPCPATEPKAHSNLCCGKEMRLVEEGAREEPAAAEASP